jgi:hypothetical protein
MDTLIAQGTWFFNEIEGYAACRRELGASEANYTSELGCLNDDFCIRCANQLLDRHVHQICLSERFRRSVDNNNDFMLRLISACTSDACRQAVEQIRTMALQAGLINSIILVFSILSVAKRVSCCDERFRVKHVLGS